MYTVTLPRVLAVLAFYGGLYVIIRGFYPSVRAEERKSLWIANLSWAVSVFIANDLLAWAGLMSPLPLVNNVLHTFVWIGFCLSRLYFGVREPRSMPAQFVIFATFSLVVKIVEHIVFRTWELGHFFHILHGNAAYVLGWSLADGLYPPITFYGLRLIARRVKGVLAL